MSKMHGVFAVRIAIDPTDAHVKAPRANFGDQGKQQGALSTVAHVRHRSFRAHDLAGQTGLRRARRSARRSREKLSALRLPVLVEKAKRRRYGEIDGANSADMTRLVRRERTPDAPSNLLLSAQTSADFG
jgi:hypothetical protein